SRNIVFGSPSRPFLINPPTRVTAIALRSAAAKGVQIPRFKVAIRSLVNFGVSISKRIAAHPTAIDGLPGLLFPEDNDSGGGGNGIGRSLVNNFKLIGSVIGLTFGYVRQKGGS